MRTAWAFVLVLLCVGVARADDLVSGLSQDQIQITSNYTGSDLLVFGAIEPDAESDVAPTGKRDIVVVVRGPDTTMEVRRKQRFAGIWINNREVTLTGMPGYYFVASTGPLGKIASEDTLERYQIGLDNVAPQTASTRKVSTTEQFRQAVVRERMRAHVYAFAPQGVEFLSQSLFRVHVPVPADAPRGQYTAQVYLFHDGEVVSAQSTPLFVDQIGLERRLYNLAHDQPLAYGLAAVLMAVLLGWLSSLVFRQP
jgi:uncharacterized protein (TIGR02186 family)